MLRFSIFITRIDTKTNFIARNMLFFIIERKQK